MSMIEVKVPDIGDFDAVPIIELFVKVGDSIKAEDAICTLESDKATMDVPSPAAGVVKELLVSLGDKVSEGSVLIKIEAAGAAASAPAPAAAAPAPAAAAPAPAPAAPAAAPAIGFTMAEMTGRSTIVLNMLTTVSRIKYPFTRRVTSSASNFSG